MPMTFDQYSRCGYGCLYCFATYQKDIGLSKDNFRSGDVRSVNIDHLRRIMTEPESSQFWPFVRDRKVIQWGGLADPFCPIEQKYHKGLEMLHLFAELDYPLCFSTKGTWWTENPAYVDLFRSQKQWNVKVSIITLDEEKARAIEVRCPSVRERLDAIERIAKWNPGGVTLRLRPFIIGMSNPRHKELIQKAARRGATAVSTEFFCVEQRSLALRACLPVFNKVLGYDLFKFYKKYSVGTGYLRLNRNIKRQFVDEMEDACAKHGMRFYVSDAHFKERCANGSCCGLPPTWNYHRGQWTHALLLAKKCGRATWQDVSGELEYAKKFLFRQASGLNTTGTMKRTEFMFATMYDYLRHIWDHPNHGQSPYRMYEGIMKPVEIDKNGDVVYAYDPERE